MNGRLDSSFRDQAWSPDDGVHSPCSPGTVERPPAQCFPASCTSCVRASGQLLIQLGECLVDHWRNSGTTTRKALKIVELKIRDRQDIHVGGSSMLDGLMS